MTRPSFRDLTDIVSMFSSWKATAVCYVSLRKLLPFFHHVSTQQASQTVEKVQNLCAEFLHGRPIAPVVIGAMESEIRSTADWNCEESQQLLSVILKPLDICMFCLRAAGGESSQAEATRSLSLMRDIIQDLSDTVATISESHKEENLPAAEIDSQERIVNMLRQSERWSDSLMSQLENESTEIAEHVESLLPCYCHAIQEEDRNAKGTLFFD